VERRRICGAMPLAPCPACALQVSYMGTGTTMTVSVSPTTRPVILLLRGVAAGHVTVETSPGRPMSAARVTFPTRSDALRASRHPAAIAWDDVSPSAAHPTPGRREDLVRAAFAAAGVDGTWATVHGDDAAPWAGLHETIVRLPPCGAGAVVRLEAVMVQ